MENTLKIAKGTDSSLRFLLLLCMDRLESISSSDPAVTQTRQLIQHKHLLSSFSGPEHLVKTFSHIGLTSCFFHWSPVTDPTVYSLSHTFGASFLKYFTGSFNGLLAPRSTKHKLPDYMNHVSSSVVDYIFQQSYGGSIIIPILRIRDSLMNFYMKIYSLFGMLARYLCFSN